MTRISGALTSPLMLVIDDVGRLLQGSDDADTINARGGNDTVYAYGGAGGPRVAVL